MGPVSSKLCCLAAAVARGGGGRRRVAETTVCTLLAVALNPHVANRSRSIPRRTRDRRDPRVASFSLFGHVPCPARRCVAWAALRGNPLTPHVAHLAGRSGDCWAIWMQPPVRHFESGAGEAEEAAGAAGQRGGERPCHPPADAAPGSGRRACGGIPYCSDWSILAAAGRHEVRVRPGVGRRLCPHHHRFPSQGGPARGPTPAYDDWGGSQRFSGPVSPRRRGQP